MFRMLAFPPPFSGCSLTRSQGGTSIQATLPGDGLGDGILAQASVWSTVRHSPGDSA